MFEASPFDERIEDFAGSTTTLPITLAHPDESSPTTGSDAFVMHAVFSELNRFSAPVGEPTPFDFLAQGNYLANGKILADANLVSADTDYTGYELGALSATQKMIVTVHVSAMTGFTNADFNIESDATDSWSGSETTRATASITAIANSGALVVSGAVTDTWWRLSLDVTGSGFISFTVAAGIT